MNEIDTIEDNGPNISWTITPEDNITTLNCDQVLSSSSVDPEIEIFDRIANKLLRSGLLLTALELHAELIERGKELPRLREFFDNPHNFEKQIENTNANKLQELNVPNSKNVVRSPSEQTFDSIDFTQYSDDDVERHGDERIAVLEFELRKAHQTINSLRASLTLSTTDQFETNSNVKQANLETVGAVNIQPSIVANSSLPDSNSFSDHLSLRDYYSRGSGDGDSCPGEDDRMTGTNIVSVDNIFDHGMNNQESKSYKYSISSSIKPHEKRAINYLINEYLMANNNKLTSITFCDENADQDFEKWDDVGLNTDRPPDLLRLYRCFWQNCSSSLRCNSTSTSMSTINSKTIGKGELTDD
ncbi:hypothetical protein BLOT_001338 [Blomia tropicalis]|nr:hypothetical protein BLOT_001338 [Blomia tropicalis]